MVRDILLTNMVNELVTMDAILGIPTSHVVSRCQKTGQASPVTRRGAPVIDPSLAPEKPRKCVVVFGMVVLAAHLRGLKVSKSIQTRP
jgi:hypothetical protein